MTWTAGRRSGSKSASHCLSHPPASPRLTQPDGVGLRTSSTARKSWDNEPLGNAPSLPRPCLCPCLCHVSVSHSLINLVIIHKAQILGSGDCKARDRLCYSETCRRGSSRLELGETWGYGYARNLLWPMRRPSSKHQPVSNGQSIVDSDVGRSGDGNGRRSGSAISGEEDR